MHFSAGMVSFRERPLIYDSICKYIIIYCIGARRLSDLLTSKLPMHRLLLFRTGRNNLIGEIHVGLFKSHFQSANFNEYIRS